MAASSRSAVAAAMVGNGFLTVIKFMAFVGSGSGAMLSESIHSLADTGNQALLYMGIRRSQRPADALFHYGYGADRFLFSLLSAVGIFVLGCGVTVYHGVHSLFHPPELRLDWVTFAVLGVSFVVEAAVLWKAAQAVAASKGDKRFWEYVRSSTDPTVLAVLFEDAVACIGVLLAAAGILLSYTTGNPVFDAISSILIGLMMGGIAVWLGYRNRKLILGPAIPRDVQRAVISHLLHQPSIQSVHDIKSRIVASDRFKLKAEIDYDGGHLAEEHVDWVKSRLENLEAANDAEVEEFARQFGERMTDSLGREIDRIEADIVQQFPELKHLDLESHWRPGD